MILSKGIIQVFRKQSIPICLYLFVNALFVLKFFQRAGFNPLASLSLYTSFVLIILFFFYSFQQKFSEKVSKVIFWSILAVLVFSIIGLLIVIDPYKIRVDRWSAITFFWDYCLHGKYPYSAHTHVSLTNYPSPFPFWQALNFPFYLLGDVGIGLIFFLLVTAFVVRYYFSSYKKSVLFIFMLCISPAYWWEVAVRSDGMNNAFFVFIIILWLRKSNRQLTNSFYLIALICGLTAATRLTAIIPLALYLFKPYIQQPWKKIITFPIIILTVFALLFSPFIFWDTNTWIFFSRNPFMSQADKGNIYIFLSMLLLGCIMAYKWKKIEEFFNTTSLFIFIFISMSQIGLIYAAKTSSNLFSDSICDISYYSLLLPYCLIAIGNGFSVSSEKIIHKLKAT